MQIFKEEQIQLCDLGEDTTIALKNLLEDIYYIKVKDVKKIDHTKWNHKVEFQKKELVFLCNIVDNKISDYELFWPKKQVGDFLEQIRN